MSVARVAQYRQLVKEAAKQLRCKPTSELARHVATLRLARSTYAERLVAGRDIDPAALLRIDEALRQYMPTGEPAGVQFTIQVAKLCAKCRAELEGRAAACRRGKAIAAALIDRRPIKATPTVK